MPAVSKSIERGMKYLAPTIQARREERAMSEDGTSNRVSLMH